MRSLVIVAILISAVAVRPSVAQDRPQFTLDEMESLLLHGRIAARKGSPRGVTDAYRVTLSDGQRTHDAQVQNGG